MKKIINNTAIILMTSIILTSCGDNEKNNESHKTSSDITTPLTAVGIGKVLPEGGLALLSVTQSNKVTHVYVKDGDTVRAGQKLFDMESIDERLQLEASQARLGTTQAQALVSEYDIKAATVKLTELHQEYIISKNLLEQNAETPQKVTQDSVAYAQQLIKINQLKQTYAAQQAQVREQQTQVKANSTQVDKQSFKVLKDGVLTSFNVVAGSVLTPSTNFAELSPLTPLIIEAELDELYAHLLKEGQKVDISIVGQSQTIAQGTIYNLGIGLQNKSIIYEVVGEANDRRVRRFSVKIDQATQPLLINQKVECKITL